VKGRHLSGISLISDSFPPFLLEGVLFPPLIIVSCPASRERYSFSLPFFFLAFFQRVFPRYTRSIAFPPPRTQSFFPSFLRKKRFASTSPPPFISDYASASCSDLPVSRVFLLSVPFLRTHELRFLTETYLLKIRVPFSPLFFFFF